MLVVGLRRECWDVRIVRISYRIFHPGMVCQDMPTVVGDEENFGR